MPDLTNGSVIITSPTAPATNVKVPRQSTAVLTTPGVAGPPGPSIQLTDAVATYGDLPDDLTAADSGKAYVVNANGKLYAWDGDSFPLEANGADFRGETGPAGRGVDDITLQGTDVIRFHMSDASNEDVTVPTITAAAASATAAATSASSAATSATNAAGSATAASGSATAAAGSATTASTQAGNAAASATAADASADAAALSETAAASSATAADASADLAAVEAADAETSATSAVVSASNSATSATASATAKDLSVAAKDTAQTAATNASNSADAAAASAADAAASAEEAADIVSSGIPSATDVVKGGVLLPGVVSGELGGTFDHPTVTGWADKADLVGGKVPSGQIPSIATTERYVVANTAARTALTVEVGDVAVQTGNPGRGTYFLREAPASVDANWELMVAPTDAVSSVNGYNGIVVLAKSDVGLGSVDNTADTAKPVSTAQQAALDGKAATSHTHNASDINAGTLAIGRIPTGTTSTTVPLGNDSRFTDTRTPSANTVPSDFVFVAISPTTARSTTEDWLVGQYVGRAFTLTDVVYQFDSADASGSTTIEVQKNGVQVAGTPKTVTAANQADGTGTDAARTASGLSVSFAVGDRINVIVTAVGTTPGKGARAYLKGTWN